MNEPQTETIHLQPADEAALAVITSKFDAEAELQDTFEQYSSAAANGIIDKLVAYTAQHGAPKKTPGGTVHTWSVSAEGATITSELRPDCSLSIKRNDEIVLNDQSGAQLVFEAGRGLWIQALLIEHARLEREAAQSARLADRKKVMDAAARRSREI